MKSKYQKKPWSKWYGLAVWKRLRTAQLQKQPLCVMCTEQGRVATATVCDHIEPHKGNKAKFEDPNNLQSLCKLCHDSTKAQREGTGYSTECADDGMPIDANHPWNRT